MYYGRLIKGDYRGALTPDKVYTLREREGWEHWYQVKDDVGKDWMVNKKSFVPVGEEDIKDELLKMKNDL